MHELSERYACRNFAVLAFIDHRLDFCLGSLCFCFVAGLWYCPSISLSTDHEIIVITCSAFSNCHPVAPFRLQSPGAGVTVPRTALVLVSFHVCGQLPPASIRESHSIESDEISGHAERDVIAIDPTVDRAFTDLEALRYGEIDCFAFSSRFRTHESLAFLDSAYATIINVCAIAAGRCERIGLLRVSRTLRTKHPSLCTGNR